MRKFAATPLLLVTVLAGARLYAADQQPAPQTWYFAVSGDSRNCGDIVMPAIAADAEKQNASFYWHLGDLRRTSSPDEDFIAEKAHSGNPTDLAEYHKEEWDDFIQNQINAWGNTPFYLGIGNHETTEPKSRAQFIEKFHAYLDRPDVREQRLKDNSKDEQPHTYYHWMRNGVDFIFLDNATKDQFDEVQMRWIKDVLARDKNDSAITTLVVGMHEALPESISANHSMNESTEAAIKNGREVYELLLKMQNESHKTIYVLASHSHYFMEGTFNTPYWREHGGILPGWIVGTAGAQRYPLPPSAGDAHDAKMNVYGYLLATVNPGGTPAGTIKFEFEEITEGQIPRNVIDRFGASTVHECFVGNRKNKQVD